MSYKAKHRVNAPNLTDAVMILLQNPDKRIEFVTHFEQNSCCNNLKFTTIGFEVPYVT